MELAEVQRLLGEDDEAGRHAVGALEAAGRLGNMWLAAKARLTRGRLAARGGGWAEAGRLHQAALATIWERRYKDKDGAVIGQEFEMATGDYVWRFTYDLFYAGDDAVMKFGRIPQPERLRPALNHVGVGLN